MPCLTSGLDLTPILVGLAADVHAGHPGAAECAELGGRVALAARAGCTPERPHSPGKPGPGVFLTSPSSSDVQVAYANLSIQIITS